MWWYAWLVCAYACVYTCAKGCVSSLLIECVHEYVWSTVLRCDIRIRMYKEGDRREKCMGAACLMTQLSSRSLEPARWHFLASWSGLDQLLFLCREVHELAAFFQRQCFEIATIEMAVLRALPRPLGKTILGLDSQRNATRIMIKCSSSTEASCLPTQSLRYHFSLAFDLCSFFVSIPIYLVSL